MPNDENTGVTEEIIQRSIEELGGIPVIEMELSVNGMTAYPTDKTLSIADMAADAKVVGNELASIESAVTGNAYAISQIEAWTGENIPINSESGMTIAEAFDAVVSNSYPVGSVYMTVSNNPPAFAGTWVEIGITATWNQLKSGKRDYAELAEGDVGGTVHFWLRTE